MTPKQEAQVKKTGLKLAQSLEKSCDAMNDYLRACREAGLPYKGADDGRTLLMERMTEFSCYLDSVYNKEGGAA